MIFPPENRQNGPAPKIGDGVRHDSKINALTVVNKPNLFEGEHASQQSSGVAPVYQRSPPLALILPFVVNEDGLG
jgi:hypothetical protein